MTAKLDDTPGQRGLIWNIGTRYLGYSFFCAIFSDRHPNSLQSLFIHPELFYIFLFIIGISVVDGVMASTKWIGLILFITLTATLALVTLVGHAFAGDVWYLPFRFRMVMALIGGVSALCVGFHGRSMSGALLAFLIGQFAGVAACEAALFGTRLFHTDLDTLITRSKDFLAPIVTIALATLPLAACNGIIATLANKRAAPPIDVEEPPAKEDPVKEDNGFHYR